MCEDLGLDLQKPAFWGLDPRFWAYRKVFCCTLNPEGERQRSESAVQIEVRDGLYCFYLFSSPMLRVELVGYIVAKAIRASGDDQKILYRLDDGTGLIHVTKWVKNGTDNIEDAANLGDLVTVRGKIRVYKEKLEIFAIDVIVEEDLNTEATHWLEVIDYMSTSYRQPLQLSAEAAQTLRGSLGFEMVCACTGAVKSSLLYCKCTASQLVYRVCDKAGMPVDDWELREQVLKHLLRMERAIADDSELEFTFQDVFPSLRKLALRWLRGLELQPTAADTEEIVLGLLRGLFHAFRQDGVLVLLHVYDDQYLLVSKEKVIKRAIRRAKQRWLSGVPAFTRVPSARVLLEELRASDAGLANVPDWRVMQCIQEMQAKTEEW